MSAKDLHFRNCIEIEWMINEYDPSCKYQSLLKQFQVKEFKGGGIWDILDKFCFT